MDYLQATCLLFQCGNEQKLPLDCFKAIFMPINDSYSKQVHSCNFYMPGKISVKIFDTNAIMRYVKKRPFMNTLEDASKHLFKN
jgi:hypothetical protein